MYTNILSNEIRRINPTIWYLYLQLEIAETSLNCVLSRKARPTHVPVIFGAFIFFLHHPRPSGVLMKTRMGQKPTSVNDFFQWSYKGTVLLTLAFRLSTRPYGFFLFLTNVRSFFLTTLFSCEMLYIQIVGCDTHTTWKPR